MDIFFVISGFLISSHLLRELERHGRISVSSFYARRALRLLPAATVVLIATGIATLLFVPRIVWQQYGTDLASSAVYVVNWVLASRSVDYLAEDVGASPFQHFWSLAVEEQFYLLWPLLFIAAGVIAPKLGSSHRRVLAPLALAVVVASFGLAIAYALRGDASGYFVTTTRLWELAVGGVAAFIATSVRFPRLSGGLATGLGLIAIFASFVFLGDVEMWPSGLTALPVCGAALAMLGGSRSFDSNPAARLISISPLVWIGGLSYSLYLWHWPAIALVSIVVSPSTWAACAAAGMAVCLAWLSQRFVENPIRFSRFFKSSVRKSLTLGLTLALLTAGLGVGIYVMAPRNVLAKPDGATALGAEVLAAQIATTPTSGLTAAPKWVTPDPLSAPQDVPALYADGCQQSVADASALSCVYGAVDGDVSVAVVGDSKAGQWLPALEPSLTRHGIAIVTYLKSRCAFSSSTTPDGGSAYSACDTWNDNVLEALRESPPDYLITSQVLGEAWLPEAGATSRERRAAMAEGVAKTLGAVRELGTRVIVLGDTPQTGTNVYECVAEHPEEVSECSYERESAISNSAYIMQREAVDLLDGTVLDASGAKVTIGDDADIWFLDMNDAICPDPSGLGECQPIIGNVLVYRQGSHITASYMRTLAPRMSSVLSVAGVFGTETEVSAAEVDDWGYNSLRKVDATPPKAADTGDRTVNDFMSPASG